MTAYALRCLDLMVQGDHDGGKQAENEHAWSSLLDTASLAAVDTSMSAEDDYER